MSRTRMGLPPAPWKRLSRPGDKCRAFWVNPCTGWGVRHCGHPTANWPYCLVDPARPHRATVTHNGLGFVSLALACRAADRVAVGELVATCERCGPTTQRVLCVEDDGDVVPWREP